jgi:nucleotide-binding universal stress UspA family protein
VSLLNRVLVPIASEADARATAAALRPHLDGIDRVVVLHVIEKGGGVVDKAPLEKRQADAEEFLGVAEAEVADDVTVDTRVAYGTDVVETVFDVATEVDATAVAFRPRGGSRIARLLSGDTATKLATNPMIPTVSLPDPEDA